MAQTRTKPLLDGTASESIPSIDAVATDSLADEAISAEADYGYATASLIAGAPYYPLFDAAFPIVGMTTTSFDPEFMDLSGKAYLEVRNRVLWFRKVHPFGAILCTEDANSPFTKQLANGKTTLEYVFTCEIQVPIRQPDGELVPWTLATARGSETVLGFDKGPREKAETVAIGRALAACGFGTQFALDLGDGIDGKLADSPIVRDMPPAVQPAGKGGHLLDEARKLGATPVKQAYRALTSGDVLPTDVLIDCPEQFDPLRWVELIAGFEVEAENSLPTLNFTSFKNAYKVNGGTAADWKRVFGGTDPDSVVGYLAGEQAIPLTDTITYLKPKD